MIFDRLRKLEEKVKKIEQENCKHCLKKLEVVDSIKGIQFIHLVCWECGKDLENVTIDHKPSKERKQTLKSMIDKL